VNFVVCFLNTLNERLWLRVSEGVGFEQLGMHEDLQEQLMALLCLTINGWMLQERQGKPSSINLLENI
jgi:hypothetical protein